MDYAGLIEEIRYYFDDVPLVLQAADAIEELQKAVNFHKFNSELWEDKYNSLADEKWIPVTERLPKEMETVLVTDGKNVGWSFCVNDYGTMEFYSPWTVTHWMPLPEPPKEET